MTNILIAYIILLVGAVGWHLLDKAFILDDLKYYRKRSKILTRKLLRQQHRIHELNDRLSYSEFEASMYRDQAMYMNEQLNELNENYQALKMVSNGFSDANEVLMEKLLKLKSKKGKNGKLKQKTVKNGK